MEEYYGMVGDPLVDELMSVDGYDDDGISGIAIGDPVIGDIIGDIVGDIVGAPAAARVRALARRDPRQALQAARAALLAKQGAQMAAARAVNPAARQYNPPNWDKSRELPLGIPTTNFLANQSLAIEVRPNVPYRSRRLYVPSTIGVNFLLTDVKVGANSQNMGSGPIPCEIFSEVSVGNNMLLDTCELGQTITLFLQNTTGAAQTFNGNFLGAAVRN